MKKTLAAVVLVALASLSVHAEILEQVLVKVNGIARQNMGTNKELVLPFIEAMIGAAFAKAASKSASCPGRTSNSAISRIMPGV